MKQNKEYQKQTTGTFMRFAIIAVRNFTQKNLLLLKENTIFVVENAIQNIVLKSYETLDLFQILKSP